MLMDLVVGTLCAFGALSALWAVLGWLLPRAEGCVMVCFGVHAAGTLWRMRWLKSLGLLECPLVLAAEENGEAGLPGMEIWSREALLARLEWERNRTDGTGNGDHTGRHQCGGLSEL